MLPFLKDKQEGSASAPIESVERKSDHDDDHAGLEAACQDLFDAWKSGNVKAGAAALKAAFEICDSGPHYEGPHTGE